MEKIVTKAILKKMWANSSPALITEIVAQMPDVFERYGITTPLRAAHFMAQISHESDGGTITAENLNYTTAARIAAVWPTRFTPASAAPYVRNPKKLASQVYNGRMGNRVGTDDGYTYRGRGLLQITGRASYRDMGKLTGLDLEGNPDLASDPRHTLLIAAAEFRKLNCLPACDDDNITLVTKRVNGGYNGLASRKQWLAKWKTALADIPDTPASVRVAMGCDVPRGADPGKPEKGMLQSTEGNAAVAGGALGLLQTVTDVSGQVSSIKTNADSAGLFDVIGKVMSSPSFWLGVAIVGACAYLWFRRRWRLHVEAA